MMKEQAMTNFDASKVTKVYLGKDRVCRCGCAGEYVYRGEPKFEKRVANFARKLADYTLTQDDLGDNFMNVSYGNDRALTVYFD